MAPPAVLSYVIRGGGATCASVCAAGGTAARPGYGLLARGEILAKLVALNLAGRRLGQPLGAPHPCDVAHAHALRRGDLPGSTAGARPSGSLSTGRLAWPHA